MTKTIQTALSPLLVIGSFCGLGFIEYPVGQLRPYLTCLYILISWSFFGYLFYYLIYTSHTFFVFLNSTGIIIVLTGVATMVVSLFQFKGLKMCLHKLSIVDDTLEVLGTPKEYQRLYKWVIRMIIGWIISAFLLNSLDSFTLNLIMFEYASIARICAPFMGNYFLHINTLSGLIWGTILRYIGSRFQKINEHISYHLLESDTEYIRRRNKLIFVRQRRTEAKKCRQYLWIIMHVHLQLCVISRELNKVFSIQMTLQMASYFALFVELYIELYTRYIYNINTFGKSLDNEIVYIWIVIFSAKLLILNYICQIICNKANKTITILYELSNDSPDEDLRDQALQFILQIKQRELKFTGMGLFYFGYNFIRKFYVSFITVAVIITQLGMTDILYIEN